MTQSNKESALVSFLLFVYNQEKFVEEAVRAALAQTYEPLEIVISDDASTDCSYEIAKSIVDLYHGPHRVTVRKNVKNMGINPHINLVVGEAQGKFIVVAAGDDVSMPERTAKLVKHWQAGAVGVFSNATLIDPQGNSRGLLVSPGYRHMADWQAMALAGTHGVWGCTLSWEKRVFNTFGEMQEDIIGEDAVVPFRCALLGGISYIDESLVKYREHGENVSFWAREKGLDQAAMIELGAYIMQFKEQMYANWTSDLNLANAKGLIDRPQLDWGRHVLNENTLLARKMEDLLRSSLIATLLLPVWAIYFSIRIGRFAPLFFSLKKTVWKLLNGFLHYRMPRLHRQIRRLLGRNL